MDNASASGSTEQPSGAHTNPSSVMSIQNLLNPNPDVTESPESAANTPKRYLCFICNKTVLFRTRFVHLSSLVHQRAAGVTDPVTPARFKKRFCEVCKVAIKANNWNNHETSLSHQELMGVADPVQPTMRLCEYCGYGVDKRNWAKHTKSDTHRKATEEASSAAGQDA
ncbi:hypothetical protein P171DRAFT_502521 [Karstenula rhodostoma CBS 690.94]|uniref:Uncharacterized protein n=1 Tax=Karstenula rhodostoma CBS 690.94 TaxID=1392251 RepID=A0A9P4UI15_9PLEO|nr:hypothetical protein P171DRAFT_502521 [Karstenula rhodostoma CBS 690.94]